MSALGIGVPVLSTTRTSSTLSGDALTEGVCADATAAIPKIADVAIDMSRDVTVDICAGSNLPWIYVPQRQFARVKNVRSPLHRALRSSILMQPETSLFRTDT